MNKKGVELSLNVLIIAIIGLLVLLVLSAIFLGRIGSFGQKAGDCEVQGGKCAIECGNPDFGTADMKKNVLATCAEVAGESRVCCIPLTT